MNSLPWEQAARSLALYYGLGQAEPPQTSGLPDVEAFFRNSSLAIAPLHAGPARFGSGLDGALVALADGGWSAIVRHNGFAYALTPEGRRGAVLEDQDLATVRHGYAFYEKDENTVSALSFYRRHKKKAVQILACGLLTNFFGLSLPLFSSFVYDKLLGNHIHETLWALAIGFFLLAVLDFSLRSLRILIAEKFALSAESDIDSRLFQSLLGAKMQQVPSVGSFLDRYKRLLASRDMLSSSYLLALADIPFLFLFALAMFAASGALVLVPLVFGSLVLLSNVITAVPLYDYDRRSRVPEDKKFRTLTDALASQEALTSSLLAKEMASRWGDACAQTSSLQSLVRYWRSMGMTVAGSLTFISYISVLIGGVYMVDALTLTSGGLLAASMLSSRMMSGFSSVVTIATRYKDFRTALKEMNALLPSLQKTSGHHEARKLPGRISFDAVTCRLQKEANPILSTINTRINPGEMVGIAGIPGSGKTTFLRLVCGALAPESGAVLIDHFPVNTLRVEDLAATIGYKPQDFCLVEGTIEDNVRAGAPALTDQQREHVLTASGLGWVFQQGGLDWTTEVGPRGSHLSGGQRQLVALARAFLDQKNILLLDEPTTGLDAPLEAHLTKQIAAMKKRSTLLISTHSRDILSLCDQIRVIG